MKPLLVFLQNPEMVTNYQQNIQSPSRQTSICLLGDFHKKSGDNRARTCDPMRVMHVLSQLSYASVFYCSTYWKNCNSFFEKNENI